MDISFIIDKYTDGDFVLDNAINALFEGQVIGFTKEKLKRERQERYLEPPTKKPLYKRGMPVVDQFGDPLVSRTVDALRRQHKTQPSDTIDWKVIRKAEDNAAKHRGEKFKSSKSGFADYVKVTHKPERAKTVSDTAPRPRYQFIAGSRKKNNNHQASTETRD